MTALAALAVLPGCASVGAIQGGGGYCAPAATLASVTPEPSVPGAPRNEQTLALVGLTSDAGAVSKPNEPLDVETRLRILERLELARVTIGATVAELDCEGERARQAADYLTNAQQRQVQTLTVASIAAAAATAIAGVFLSTGNASPTAQDTVGIVGGGATAGLGLASLYVHPSLPFEHTRNLLADVWSGPAASTTFPPVVWAYLTRAAFSNDQQQAIRVRIVERWRHFRSIGNDPEQQALLFGQGGRYDAATLRRRAAMLAEVKAEVALANQELSSVSGALLSR
jgi:hypothetical protein